MVCIPEAGPRQRHLAFIAANLKALQAAAVEGYREHGRGMLVIDEADFLHKPPGVLTRYRRVYVAENTPAFAAMGAWPGDTEADWVRTYNPDDTMLVCVATATGGVSSYRLFTGG